MIAATATRVSSHTSSQLNQKIREETEKIISKFSSGDPIAIEDRLQDLDREWDVERTLQTNFATLTLVSLALSKLDKRWLWLSGGVSMFMVQHAVQGWCPPLSILRRLGFRTAREIADEKFALKSVCGDFIDREA